MKVWRQLITDHETSAHGQSGHRITREIAQACSFISSVIERNPHSYTEIMVEGDVMNAEIKEYAFNSLMKLFMDSLKALHSQML